MVSAAKRIRCSALALWFLSTSADVDVVMGVYLCRPTCADPNSASQAANCEVPVPPCSKYKKPLRRSSKPPPPRYRPEQQAARMCPA